MNNSGTTNSTRVAGVAYMGRVTVEVLQRIGVPDTSSFRLPKSFSAGVEEMGADIVGLVVGVCSGVLVKQMLDLAICLLSTRIITILKNI